MKKLDYKKLYEEVLAKWERAEDACREMANERYMATVSRKRAELERDEAMKRSKDGPVIAFALYAVIAGWLVFMGFRAYEAHREITALEVAESRMPINWVDEGVFAGCVRANGGLAKELDIWRSKSMRAYEALKEHHNREAFRILDE